MSDISREKGELVSALVDGQLSDHEFGDVVDYLEAADEARAAWDTYHLVGEAMRSAGTPLRAHDPLFVERLRREIATNTTDLIAEDALNIGAEGKKDTTALAANDSWWKRVSGILSVALVGVVAWQGYLLMNARNVQDAAPQVAQLPAAASQGAASAALAAVDGAPAVMIRDPQLDALLAAHRQLGGATALQMPSGFLRNATFNEGNR